MLSNPHSIRRDDRVRSNHPIKLFRDIILIVDTPMSSPPEEKKTDLQSIPSGHPGNIYPTILGSSYEPFSRDGN